MKLIKRLRSKTGLSQRAAAIQCHTSYQRISRLEKDTPNLDALMRLIDDLRQLSNLSWEDVGKLYE